MLELRHELCGGRPQKNSRLLYGWLKSAELRLTVSLVATPPPSVLHRELGLRAMTALVVGEVIAIGIFLTPAGMARALGSPFWLLIVWLLMGRGAGAS